jgi:GrpB-like predicted nucleotidyltransferase (UPF0157 family)
VEIEIVDYDPSWAIAYQRESGRLRAALGEIAIRIDHVGSTSIPGIGAKPVIDIQISVDTLHPMDPYRERLTRVGYRHQLHPDDADYPFFHRPHHWPHSHHVHVCVAHDAREKHNLAFCSYLRDHSDTAAEYEQLKRRLAAIHSATTSQTRNAYSDAKSSFIGEIVTRALSEGYPRE